MANLTKTAVDAATCPPGKSQAFVWDAKLPSFGLRITRTGVKAYVLQYRPKGSRQDRRITLGRHGKITAAQARELAVVHFADITKGADPAAQAKAHKAELTVAAMLDRFLEEHVAVNNKPRTQKEERRLIERLIKPKLGKLKLDQLTRGKVKAWHSGLTGAKVSANRALAHLQRACRFAIEHELMADNPCQHITRNKETAKDRYFTDDELERIGVALRDLVAGGKLLPSVADGLRLLALTGLRASEAREAVWAGFDPVKKVLRLGDSKTGARNVPLFPAAFDLLSGMERHGPYVVAGPDPNEQVDERYFSKALERVLARAGVENASPHTFRHTVATFMAQNGQDAFAITHVGGWRTLHMVQRYVTRHALGDKHPLPAVQRVAIALAGGNVVPLVKTA